MNSEAILLATAVRRLYELEQRLQKHLERHLFREHADQWRIVLDLCTAIELPPIPPNDEPTPLEVPALPEGGGL